MPFTVIDTLRAQQLREATPFGRCPRYLLCDHDRQYGAAFARIAAASGIELLRAPCRAPQADAVCERYLGSVRRECPDHLLILGEPHLTRVLREYVAFFNRARPHQGLGQAVPEPPTHKTGRRQGPISAVPILGGLHDTYLRAA